MKPKKTLTVEKVEFALSDGKHVVWSILSKGWYVTVYRHGYNATEYSTSLVPSLKNAIYFGKKKQPVDVYENNSR